ncbi:hypothetical protein, partial [Endozoicomonas numazuensis]|uniref:hypothetical protein n=1 Tax=Endozoicomonas numazuensis TaxID=1137799 RepID=UPI001F24F0F2
MGKRIKRLLSFRLLNVRAPFVSQIFVWFNALLLLGIGGLFIVLVLAISEEPEIRYEGGAGQDSYAHAEEWMS